MGNIQEYKCPCCGGAIVFDSAIQKMKCPCCDTEFEMEALQGYDDALKQQEQGDDMTWDTAAGSEWQDGEETGLRTYQCKSCGGEIVGDESMAASSCPYCGNPIVLMGQFSGDLRPDYVIPFKLDKKAAKAGLMKHLNGKRLLPKIFKDQNHIDEIKGVYVPFWLFDTNVDANISYRATKVRTWSDSKYDYTETRFFMLSRGGTIGFERVPVDGSSKMEDDLMESLEPYDFKDAVPFKDPYLAGYVAERYDVEADECKKRAKKRAKASIKRELRDTVKGYSIVKPVSDNVKIQKASQKYALYPVWILNTTWRDQKYVFAMNGQTGKMVGDLPADKGAFWKYVVSRGLVIGVILYALMWLTVLI